MRFTFFQSPLDRSASTHTTTWSDLCSWIENPPEFRAKTECPLIKLAVFGNTPSDKGFMRHDANVVAITGIEADYDGELVSVDDAIEKLRAAGVRCLIYTSASHSQDKPRWRVFVPLSNEYQPQYRNGFLDHINAILGGVIARESWALSQAYFCGRVSGVSYETVVIDGKYIDELTEAVAAPIAPKDIDDLPEWRHVDIDGLPISNDFKALIRNGADRGERSEALMTAANALAQARVRRDDILCILCDPAYLISAKALDGRQQTSAMRWLARHTVRKALERHPPPDVIFAEPIAPGMAQKRRKLLASAGELIARNEPIEYQIDGVLERGVLGMVFGDPGGGKSYAMIDWACSIATGTPWTDRVVSNGAVVYVAGEGFGGLNRRLRAWSQHRNVPLNEAPLHVTQRAVNFGDAQALGELVGEITTLPDKPSLIVVDTLARATPGMDENSAKEVSAFIAACDRLRELFDCTVLIVHHSGHGDKARAKGSIALKGAVDFEARVAIGKQSGTLVIECTKMKDGEPFDPIYLKFQTVSLTPVGDFAVERSSVLTKTDKPSPSWNMSPADCLLRDILGDRSMQIDDAKEAFIERYKGASDESDVTRDTKRTTFDRAVERGRRHGAIVDGPETGIISWREGFATDTPRTP